MVRRLVCTLARGCTKLCSDFSRGLARGGGAVVYGRGSHAVVVRKSLFVKESLCWTGLMILHG